MKNLKKGDLILLKHPYVSPLGISYLLILSDVEYPFPTHASARIVVLTGKGNNKGISYSQLHMYETIT